MTDAYFTVKIFKYIATNSRKNHSTERAKVKPEFLPEKEGLQQYSTRNDCKLSHLNTNIRDVQSQQ